MTFKNVKSDQKSVRVKSNVIGGQKVLSNSCILIGLEFIYK